MASISLHLTLGKGLTAMLYNKGSIVGYSGEVKRKVLEFKFDYLMTDDELGALLYSLRENLNEMGEGLSFKLNLESEDY